MLPLFARFSRRKWSPFDSKRMRKTKVSRKRLSKLGYANPIQALRLAFVLFISIFILARFVTQFEGALRPIKEGEDLLSQSYHRFLDASQHTSLASYLEQVIPGDTSSKISDVAEDQSTHVLSDIESRVEALPIDQTQISVSDMIEQSDKGEQVNIADSIHQVPESSKNGMKSTVDDKTPADISTIDRSEKEAEMGADNQGTDFVFDNNNPSPTASTEEKELANSIELSPKDDLTGSNNSDEKKQAVAKDQLLEKPSDTKNNFQVTKTEAQIEQGAPSPPKMTNVKAPDQSPPKTLSQHLNFTDRTAMNYMHFHKTGGVSFKTALFSFFSNKKKRNGEPVRVRDACYMRNIPSRPGIPSYKLWRCDWAPVWAQPVAERAKLDVVFGHQYWQGGAADFLRSRDMRTFSVIRHPFDRKVSFFFHFFVREHGRREEDVTFEEAREFLLYDRLRDDDVELGSDVGPNYMAGRLLSSGAMAFAGGTRHRYFLVEQDRKRDVAERAIRILRDYLFVGLQSESAASMCMLRKTIEHFNEAHGINNTGTERVAASARVLNSGSYSLTASKIWRRLSMEERILFDRKERVDLSIYEEGEKLFKRQIRMFGCDHLVQRQGLLGS